MKRVSTPTWRRRLTPPLLFLLAASLLPKGALAHVPSFVDYSDATTIVNPDIITDAGKSRATYACFNAKTSKKNAYTTHFAKFARSHGERVDASLFLPITDEEGGLFQDSVFAFLLVHPNASCDSRPLDELNATLPCAGELSFADFIPTGTEPLEWLPLSKDQACVDKESVVDHCGDTFEPFGATSFTTLNFQRFFSRAEGDHAFWVVVGVCPSAFVEFSQNELRVGFTTGVEERFSAGDLFSLPVDLYRVHLWERQIGVWLFVPGLLVFLVVVIVLLVISFKRESAKKSLKSAKRALKRKKKKKRQPLSTWEEGGDTTAGTDFGFPDKGEQKRAREIRGKAVPFAVFLILAAGFFSATTFDRIIRWLWGSGEAGDWSGAGTAILIILGHAVFVALSLIFLMHSTPTVPAGADESVRPYMSRGSAILLWLIIVGVGIASLFFFGAGAYGGALCLIIAPNFLCPIACRTYGTKSEKARARASTKAGDHLDLDDLDLSSGESSEGSDAEFVTAERLNKKKRAAKEYLHADSLRSVVSGRGGDLLDLN